MSWQRNKRLILVLGFLLLAGGGLAGAYWFEREQGEAQLAARAGAITGGSVAKGRLDFQAFGCGTCHSLEGIPQATGKVGPPLDGIGQRVILAGRLANTPANMTLWISHPRTVDPQTAMPELGVTPIQARDITAFLYSRP